MWGAGLGVPNGQAGGQAFPWLCRHLLWSDSATSASHWSTMQGRSRPTLCVLGSSGVPHSGSDKMRLGSHRKGLGGTSEPTSTSDQPGDEH